MSSAVHRVLRVLLAVCVLCAALPSLADAASLALRPDSDASVGTQWSIDGSGAWAVLDDVLVQPTTPAFSADRLSSSVNGPAVAEVHTADPTLSSGETVSRAEAWVHAATGSDRSLLIELRSGSTVLASTTVAAGTSGAWHSAASTTALTQAQLDDVRVRVTMQGNGSSSATTVHAAYVRVQTNAPVISHTAPAPVAQMMTAAAKPAAAKPALAGNAPAAGTGATVEVSEKITIGRDGVIPLRFACPADSPGNCVGEYSIVIPAPVDTCTTKGKRTHSGGTGRKAGRCSKASRRARAAAAGTKTKPKSKARPRVVASGSFDLKPGEQRTIRALSRRGRIRAIRRSRGKCRVEVTTHSLGRPTTQAFPITLVPSTEAAR